MTDANQGFVFGKEVAETQECVKRDMLAYVSYPRGGAKRCFSYPQWVIEENRVRKVAPSAFPNIGCLPMVVSGADMDYMVRTYGSLVLMRVNESELRENNNYPAFEESCYNSIISPHYPSGASTVEFTALSHHDLSSSLIQAIELDERLDFSRPFAHPTRLQGSQEAPGTNLVVVRQWEGREAHFYGPFECSVVDDGLVALKSAEAYCRQVAKIPAHLVGDTLGIRDAQGNEFAEFLSAAAFKEEFDRAESLYDWISDQELLDAAGRIARQSELPFSKNQMRTLKAEIAKAQENEAKIPLNDERRHRMESLLSTYEDWAQLSDTEKENAVAAADPAQLAQYVLNDKHFAAFFDKVMEDERISDRVQKARKEAEQVEQAAREAREELERCQADLEARKEEVTAQVEREIGQKVVEREGLKQEVESLKDERAGLEEACARMEQQAQQIIADLSNQETLVRKVMEDQVLKQVLAGVRGQAPSGKGMPAQDSVPALLLRPDQDELSAQEVLAGLTDAICNKAGREMTANQVANVMICLTQGYMTTLAGLPGSGKTSLAGILAGVLGLVNAESRRFAEISVERGWTSYKDFVGYYNPLTQTTEKANALAFDAFAALDAEVAEGRSADQAAPYLFLLDEANLSSLEHYWSPFLRACDSFERGPFPLALGGSCTFRVPPYVRFLATVNFDHTTEELSPRFLDRSWTITLDSETMDLEEDLQGAGLFDADYDFGATRALSYQTLTRVFGVRKGGVADLALRQKLQEVLAVCEQHGAPVSHRSQRMMWNYIRTAYELMSHSVTAERYAPVDFAVVQKVLPLLAGTEEKLEGLLDALAKVGGLPLTNARVRHMREMGSESGFYQYFA